MSSLSERMRERDATASAAQLVLGWIGTIILAVIAIRSLAFIFGPSPPYSPSGTPGAITHFVGRGLALVTGTFVAAFSGGFALGLLTWSIRMTWRFRRDAGGRMRSTPTSPPSSTNETDEDDAPPSPAQLVLGRWTRAWRFARDPLGPLSRFAIIAWRTMAVMAASFALWLVWDAAVFAVSEPAVEPHPIAGIALIVLPCGVLLTAVIAWLCWSRSRTLRARADHIRAGMPAATVRQARSPRVPPPPE